MVRPAFGVVKVDRVECSVHDQPWPFAAAERGAIDRHWDAAVRRQPALFDGRVLMQTTGAVEEGSSGGAVFRGAYTEVAFRDFLAWRDFGYPMPGFRNGFAMAALQASDGAFVLGEMGPQTANAGRVYFPSGTPDLSDVAGNSVDLEGSTRRELLEETGLDPATLVFAPGFYVLEDTVRVCFMKPVRSPEPADALVARIHATIARQDRPELVGMHVVRRTTDITTAMPPFVAAYLRFALQSPDQSG